MKNKKTKLPKVDKDDLKHLGEYSVWSAKKVNSKFYGTLEIKGDDTIKPLTSEQIENGEQGYIFVPWTVQEHTEESLKKHKIFMDAYKKQHELCPKCGDKSHTSTLMGYVLYADKPDEYKDLNRCECTKCGDRHTAHERISELKFIENNKK